MFSAVWLTWQEARRRGLSLGSPRGAVLSQCGEEGFPTEGLGCDEPRQSLLHLSTHLEMRDVPDGALELKPKVQAEKGFP